MAYVSQEDKKNLTPAIKAVLAKFKMKASISVSNHSTLVVTIKSGAIDIPTAGRGYVDVNEYWIDKHYEGKARDFLNSLLKAMKGPDYFCHDDIQSDYFSRSHYTSIRVGSYSKHYVLTK